ncbi:FAD-dependent oxidoreductase [Nocardioides sp. SYSU D00038]|uniref:FAD-dependent oxidoreductase n=1 Tax=Nocardioides sp. SYSU D00038 TaxID=2812554 RepID=UPI00196713C3|nr:FAD-dependent oxidoreductase [Nocardioides sp. SYSU D00038]
MARVTVVGAGVVGLTSAVRLLEAGHRVDVLARDLPGETTSAVAAALWYPYLALPQDRVTAWSRTSYAAFARLADEQPAAGVRMRPGSELRRTAGDRPWWADAVPDLVDEPALTGPYERAWTFTAPVVEMPVYLGWLVERVLALGGTVTRLNLSALPSGADVVVNCSGIGARHLAGDLGVVPVRGQVVRVAQTGIERWALDAEGPTYVVPRSHDVVVGGTEVEGEWSRTPSPEIAGDVLRRAIRLVPELAGAEVLSHKVGLRPRRAEVRVERVDDVVHSYGHGGAGVTLSWGCAEEVVALVGG